MKPVIILAVCAAACFPNPSQAEKPASPLAKGRTLKVPKANATPTPKDSEVIDSRRLAELSQDGRIAAVGADGTSTSVAPPTVKVRPKGRAHWRSQYRKQRDRIAGLEAQVKDLKISERALSQQWLTAGSAESRARIDHRLVRIREQQRQTAVDLRSAKNDLQRITRMARAEGATPDWFRGLR